MMAKSIPVLLVALMTGVIFAASASAQLVDVAVVVNPANPVGSISLTDLHKILDRKSVV